MITLLADTGLPGWLKLLISLIAPAVVCAALNFVIEKIAYRPLRNAPRLAPLITAMGMSHAAADAGDDHLEAQLQALSDPAARASRSTSAGR